MYSYHPLNCHCSKVCLGKPLKSKPYLIHPSFRGCLAKFPHFGYRLFPCPSVLFPFQGFSHLFSSLQKEQCYMSMAFKPFAMKGPLEILSDKGQQSVLQGNVNNFHREAETLVINIVLLHFQISQSGVGAQVFFWQHKSCCFSFQQQITTKLQRGGHLNPAIHHHCGCWDCLKMGGLEMYIFILQFQAPGSQPNCSAEGPSTFSPLFCHD